MAPQMLITCQAYGVERRQARLRSCDCVRVTPPRGVSKMSRERVETGPPNIALPLLDALSLSAAFKGGTS
jgi:hypothetical protein